MYMAAFWVVALCAGKVYESFWGQYCLQHQGDDGWNSPRRPDVVAVGISEMLVNLPRSTLGCNPKDSQLRTQHHETVWANVMQFAIKLCAYASLT